jgi:CHAD domain-containing protein
MSERDERVGEAIRSSLRESVEAALGHMPGEAHAEQQDGQGTEAVHEVRKCFKKVRAALRLARDGLGEEVYRQENACFRDAARPLTEVRDAEVLVETWGELRSRLPEGLEQASLDAVGAALIASHDDVAQHILIENRAFAGVEAIAEGALTRLAGLSIDVDAWRSTRRGLRRVYGSGRRALARARNSATVEDLHEWRKQAKYLWAGCEILAAVWPALAKKPAKRLHELWRLLGDDHDLAVLRGRLVPLLRDDDAATRVFEAIDARRAELEETAFQLGRRLYRKRPRAFVRRLRLLGVAADTRRAPKETAAPAEPPSVERAP